MNAIQQNTTVQEKIDNWFSSFIDHLKVDHLLISTNTAAEDKLKFYNAMIDGDTDKLLSEHRSTTSIYFVKKLVFDYLEEIKVYGKTPRKLAFGLSDSKILVWAEIEDNDEETQDALLLVEAKTNAKYFPLGFYVNSTIVEAADNVPPPKHYQNIIK